MKKLLVALLTAAMLLSFSGCDVLEGVGEIIEEVGEGVEDILDDVTDEILDGIR